MKASFQLTETDLSNLLFRYIDYRTACEYDGLDDIRTQAEKIADFSRDKNHPNKADVERYVKELLTAPRINSLHYEVHL